MIPGTGSPPALQAPPSAGASPPGNMSSMLASLTQKAANGQLPPEAMMMLSMLAGAGLDSFTRSMEKLRGPKPGPTHKGVGADAARGAPGMAVNPQLIQLLMRLRGGAAPGGASGMPPGMPAMPAR